MDLISVSFPPAWQWGALLLLLPLLLWALYTAPWRRFESTEAVHVWYGAILAMVLLWSIKASLGTSFTLHLLGASVLALLVGARLALIGVAVAVAMVAALREGLWANYAISVLATGAVPIAVTTIVLKAVERYLPPNIFIYFFCIALMGSGLAMLGSGWTAAVAIAVGARETPAVDDALLYLVYLAFGEATISGMVMTLFVVYQPSWVTSFDDTRYLQR